MCVFVLFCSVVVSFVVGRQQHRRCIVIDAMVYPKNWIFGRRIWYWKDFRSLWTEYGIPTSGFAIEEDFEFGSYNIVHESTGMSFG